MQNSQWYHESLKQRWKNCIICYIIECVFDKDRQNPRTNVPGTRSYLWLDLRNKWCCRVVYCIRNFQGMVRVMSDLITSIYFMNISLMWLCKGDNCATPNSWPSTNKALTIWSCDVNDVLRHEHELAKRSKDYLLKCLPFILLLLEKKIFFCRNETSESYYI